MQYVRSLLRHAGSLAVVRGFLSSSGAQAPECKGSLVVAHGFQSSRALEFLACRLSCPTVCGILCP